MIVKVPFIESDIMCPCGCETYIINNSLMLMMSCADLITSLPIIISSWCRCKRHNKSKGGVYNSGHLLGEAVDILTINEMERFEMVKILVCVGFKQIIIYNDHIHTDVSKTKTSPYLGFKGG